VLFSSKCTCATVLVRQCMTQRTKEIMIDEASAAQLRPHLHQENTWISGVACACCVKATGSLGIMALRVLAPVAPRSRQATVFCLLTKQRKFNADDINSNVTNYARKSQSLPIDTIVEVAVIRATKKANAG